MPTYVYACKNCGHRFEKYQSFSEDSLVTCPDCAQEALRKVFDSVGIVFKGPGFYSTDSQSSQTGSGSSSTPAAAGAEAGADGSADTATNDSTASGNTSSGGSAESGTSSSSGSSTEASAAAS